MDDLVYSPPSDDWASFNIDRTIKNITQTEQFLTNRKTGALRRGIKDAQGKVVFHDLLSPAQYPAKTQAPPGQMYQGYDPVDDTELFIATPNGGDTQDDSSRIDTSPLKARMRAVAEEAFLPPISAAPIAKPSMGSSGPRLPSRGEYASEKPNDDSSAKPSSSNNRSFLPPVATPRPQPVAKPSSNTKQTYIPQLSPQSVSVAPRPTNTPSPSPANRFQPDPTVREGNPNSFFTDGQAGLFNVPPGTNLPPQSPQIRNTSSSANPSGNKNKQKTWGGFFRNLGTDAWETVAGLAALPKVVDKVVDTTAQGLIHQTAALVTRDKNRQRDEQQLATEKADELSNMALMAAGGNDGLVARTSRLLGQGSVALDWNADEQTRRMAGQDALKTGNQIKQGIVDYSYEHPFQQGLNMLSLGEGAIAIQEARLARAAQAAEAAGDVAKAARIEADLARLKRLQLVNNLKKAAKEQALQNKTYQKVSQTALRVSKRVETVLNADLSNGNPFRAEPGNNKPSIAATDLIDAYPAKPKRSLFWVLDRNERQRKTLEGFIDAQYKVNPEPLVQVVETDVKHMAKKMGVNSSDLIDEFHIEKELERNGLDSAGGFVVESDSGKRKIIIKLASLSESLPERLRLSAHELGHAIQHAQMLIDFKGSYEKCMAVRKWIGEGSFDAQVIYARREIEVEQVARDLVIAEFGIESAEARKAIQKASEYIAEKSFTANLPLDLTKADITEYGEGLARYMHPRERARYFPSHE